MAAPCNINHKFDKEPMELLKELSSNQYLIADVTQQTEPSTTDLLDQARAAMGINLQKILFRRRTPVCEVIDKIDRMETRYPKEISYVVLKHRVRDERSCRPVRRTVTYIERLKDCHKKLNKKLFTLKTKQYVVAFEAMKN